METAGYISLSGEMSNGSFSGVIMPGDAIVLEESKETVLIPYKTILIFGCPLRCIVLPNDLFVKVVHWLLKLVEMPLL
jgi:hypothetical protein